MPRLHPHRRAAQRAIDAHLREQRDKPWVLLFTLSVVADASARERGRKTPELFTSLGEYTAVLPDGVRTRWIQQGSGDLWVAVNPHYHGPVPPELQERHQPIPGPFDVATDAHVRL